MFQIKIALNFQMFSTFKCFQLLSVKKFLEYVDQQFVKKSKPWYLILHMSRLSGV